MNPSTAQNRLVKDLLFAFVLQSGHTCFRCGLALERHNFSIEHKESWQRSEAPLEAFFDLDNIAYSHLSCNVSAAYHGEKPHGRSRYQKGCRCDICKSAVAAYKRKKYSPDYRHNRYIQNEKQDINAVTRY